MPPGVSAALQPLATLLNPFGVSKTINRLISFKTEN
jgi:hypothetical protein